MKRIAASLVVFVVSLLLPLSAQARNVESKQVKQSREAVVSYWTPERMRNAKPVERKRDPFGKPAASGGGKGAKPGAATEVPAPYTVFPTSTNGKVFFTDNGVNYVCSGTAIASANESVVWTAGHCVNEGPGAYYTNWAFVPAYRDNTRPYGTWAARSLHTTTPWQSQGDFSYDLGAAVVSPSGASTLTDAIGGGRTLAFNYPRSQRYNSYGYPAASPFNGQRLWMCDSSLYTKDSSTSPQTMGIQCNMTGGSSGGGWVGPGDGRVYSVNSYGYSSLRNVMFGPYQGDVAEQLFATAAAG
jgi:hypothetical protein